MDEFYILFSPLSLYGAQEIETQNHNGDYVKGVFIPYEPCMKMEGKSPMLPLMLKYDRSTKAVTNKHTHYISQVFEGDLYERLRKDRLIYKETKCGLGFSQNYNRRKR